jgi:hypothetical protein
VDEFDEIESRIKKLEQELEVWKEEFGQFRERFPLMNLYNNKQCLVLRRHLFPLTNSIKNLNQMPPQALTLLKTIHENVNLRDIERAFYASYATNNNRSDDWQKAEVDVSSDENNFILFPDRQQIEGWIDELMDTYDIDEVVAKASFIHICPFEMKEAIKWCTSQKDPDSDDIYNASDKFDEEIERLYIPDE